MKKYSIEITDPAADDISELYRYISAKLLEPGSAARVYTAVKRAILSLDAFPERGAVVPEQPYLSLGVRRLYVENYTVFYIVDQPSACVTILRVLYSRRDWKPILDGENE